MKSDICRVAQGPVDRPTDRPTGQRNCFSDCVAFRGSLRGRGRKRGHVDGATDAAGEKRIVNVAIRGSDNEAKNAQWTCVSRSHGALMKYKTFVSSYFFSRINVSKPRAAPSEPSPAPAMPCPPIDMYVLQERTREEGKK